MSEEMNVGMKCIKYMLFVANFMFLMIGFLLISIGSTVKSIYEDFDAFMELHYFSPSSLAIAVGILMFFVAIFGCIGALKESTCLINTFGFFLGLVLVVEVFAAITAYSMRTNIASSIRFNMEVTMDEYSSSNYSQDVWDFTQSRLYCCGIDGPTDWAKYGFNASTGVPVPPEGTVFVPASCSFNDGQEMWRSGCLSKLAYIVSECAMLLGCGAVAVAFIQFLGVVFAGMLAKAVRRIKTQNLVEAQLRRQNLCEQMTRNTDEKPTPVLYTNYTPAYSEA